MNIDWTQTLVAAIAGGLIGLLVAVAKLLYGKLAPRLGASVAVLAIASAFIALAAAAFYSPLGTRAADRLAERRVRARIARAMAEPLKPVLESEAFQRRIVGMSPPEVAALAQQLSSQGLLRVSDPQRVRRVLLISEALSEADEATCAAMLLGPSPDQAQGLLRYLSRESLAEFAQLAADSAAASLRDDPRPNPSQAEVQDALRRLTAASPAAEAVRLSEALANPAALDPADACWTARTIYQRAAALPDGDRVLVARILAMQ